MFPVWAPACSSGSRKSSSNRMRCGLGLVCCLALAACYAEQELNYCTEVIPGEHYVAGLLSYEGALPLGSGLEKSLIMATHDINARGGVRGADLGLVLCDCRTGSAGAVAAMEQILDMPKIMVAIGPSTNAAALEAARMATSSIVLITPAANSPQISSLQDHGWVYRTGPSSRQIATALSDSIVARNIQKVSVIVDRSDDFRDVWREFLIIHTSRALIPSRVEYDDTDTNFAVRVLEVASAYAPQAIMILGSQQGAANIVQAAINGNVQLEHGWIFPPWLKSHNFLRDVGNNTFLEGSWGIGSSAPYGEVPTTFAQEHALKWGTAPSPYAANTYDAVFLAALGIQLAANPSDRRSVQAAMSKTAEQNPLRPIDWEALGASDDLTGVDYQGASGPADFDAAGDAVPQLEEWTISSGDFATVGCWDVEFGVRCN